MMMSEKRFKQFGLWIIDDTNSNVNSVADLIDTKLMSTNEVVDLLNEQQDQISYWKHKVSSLLWILGQFDKAKVKELLKELNNECELDEE